MCYILRLYKNIPILFKSNRKFPVRPVLPDKPRQRSTSEIPEGKIPSNYAAAG